MSWRKQGRNPAGEVRVRTPPWAELHRPYHRSGLYPMPLPMTLCSEASA